MSILNTIVGILIWIFLFLMPIGFIAGITLTILLINEKDPARKKRLKTGMIWGYVGPALMVFLLLSIWGLITIAIHPMPMPVR